MALVEVEDVAVFIVLDHVGNTLSSLGQDNDMGGPSPTEDVHTETGRRH